jgi:hypothetical protein
MAETKLARLTAREVEWLHVFRNVRDSDRDHLLEIAAQIIEARKTYYSDNVILLSDPFRKFPRTRQG